MIKKFIFGTPFETEAITGGGEIPAVRLEENPGGIPYFSAAVKEDGVTLTRLMDEGERIYGLGENIRGINKRGWIYESDCTDDPIHTEGRRELYAAHNFFLTEGRERFGVFVDAPQKVTFDLGYGDRDQMKVTVSAGGFALYLLEGDSLRQIVREFRRAIGRSYIPPKWAFGYGQSRWGYECEADIREVVRRHREEGVPLDSVYLDIDYMERYKDFTVDQEKFPDFPGFVREMRQQKIHLVPIIDAGVKIEEGYPVYEEGVENGYFCKKEDGREFVCGVWPGRVHLPDVLNEKARAWFGQNYKILLDQGIDGFWNDMNEPALFYGEDYLEEVFEKLADYGRQELDIKSFFGMKNLVLGVANRKEDYRSFYHESGDGRVRHDQVHNLYGYHMTRAAGEAFDSIKPDQRILLFSRASYVGMHRYGGVWTGDNSSWWSHLLMNLQMMVGLNMCGFLYTGADLGGFGADTTEDLLLRWLELGIFTPLMRNHSAKGTRRQEFYQFGHPEDFRNILGLRYGFLPYLYSEFVKAAMSDDMMFLPLSFVYPEDEAAAEVEDQMMVGESMMIAPVYRQNARGRYVYLPEEMKLYRFRSLTSADQEILGAGHHYVKAELSEVLVFVRPDHIVPMSEGGCSVEDIDASRLNLLHFVRTEGTYELYDDDGYRKDVDLESGLTVITVKADGTVSVSGAGRPECRLR